MFLRHEFVKPLQISEHLGRSSNTTIARLHQKIRGEQLLTTRTFVAGSLEATVLPVLAGVMESLALEVQRTKALEDEGKSFQSSMQA